jgi:chorismate mutase
MFRGFFTFEITTMNLEDCRNEIDEIDTEILYLLRRRAAFSRRIGLIKAAAGLPVLDVGREDAIRQTAVRKNGGELSNESVLRIFDEILAESQRIQLEIASNTMTEQVCK